MNCFKYVVLLGLLCTQLAFAAPVNRFVNGDFQADYTPSLSSPNATIIGWTSTVSMALP